MCTLPPKQRTQPATQLQKWPRCRVRATAPCRAYRLLLGRVGRLRRGPRAGCGHTGGGCVRVRVGRHWLPRVGLALGRRGVAGRRWVAGVGLRWVRLRAIRVRARGRRVVGLLAGVRLHLHAWLPRVGVRAWRVLGSGGGEGGGGGLPSLGVHQHADEVDDNTDDACDANANQGPGLAAPGGGVVAVVAIAVPGAWVVPPIVYSVIAVALVNANSSHNHHSDSSTKDTESYSSS
mmetsp:Transcript_29355/g.74807  ORF Transcript_29355/g.74807 Transcript_29355/m.74807 type:complete len:234 (+) Transcript_29355:858-1559(+)